MIPARMLLELGSMGLVFVGVWLAWKHWARVGWKCMASWYLLRLAVTAYVAFAVGKSVHFDLEGWVMHGQWMLEGHVPGIDFRTPYSYGFNMLLKLCAMPNGTQFQIMLLFMLAEWLALGILFFALRDLRDEMTAKRCVILYLTSPLYITLSCLWAQDETLCLLALAAVLWTACRRNEWVATIGMALVAGIALFFTKILVVYYLAPFLLLRRWKGALAASLMFLVYLGGVKCCGINPFDFVFGRELGMLQGGSENVLDFFSSGNVWSVMRKPVPYAVSGAICFVALSIVGILFLPACFRRESTVRERFEIGVEWSCAWIFVFNIFYTMTFATYILPVVPLMALFVLDREQIRPIFLTGAMVFAGWMGVKLSEVYVRWFVSHLAPGSEGGYVCVLLQGVFLFLFSAAGLAFVLFCVRDRFAWLTRRLFPEESK